MYTLQFYINCIFVYHVQCESKKIPPHRGLRFSGIFDKQLKILNQFFRHLLYVPIYARLQTFIQLTETLTKLCHIKCDYLVRVICSKCPLSAETHTFRRCFYNVNKHVGYDMTSTVT